jgi:hypothetical protein
LQGPQARLRGGWTSQAEETEPTERPPRREPPPAELIEGREAIEAFWQAGLEAGVSEVEFEALELERQDGLAYEIGRYSLRLEPADGGTVVDRGKYVLVHERQEDGSWQWAVEMFNPEAPPARADGRSKRGRSNG